MASTKSSSWPGYEKRGVTASGYDQCSASTDAGSPSRKWGQAVKAQDKSVSPTAFPKGAGKGGDAVKSGPKGEYPRSFPKGGGYDGSQPCENQLNKEESGG